MSTMLLTAPDSKTREMFVRLDMKDGVPTQKINESGRMNDKYLYLDHTQTMLFYTPSFKPMSECTADLSSCEYRKFTHGMYHTIEIIVARQRRWVFAFKLETERNDLYQALLHLSARLRADRRTQAAVACLQDWPPNDDDARESGGHVNTVDNEYRALDLARLQQIMEPHFPEYSPAEIKELFYMTLMEIRNTLSVANAASLSLTITAFPKLLNAMWHEKSCTPLFRFIGISADTTEIEHEGLLSFLRTTQGDRIGSSAVTRIMSLYSTCAGTMKRLNEADFTSFMTDPIVNGWLPNVPAGSVSDDPKLPFNRYAIRAAHNFDPTDGASLPRRYAAALQHGYRALEIPFYDGATSESEPFATPPNTRSRCTIRDVIVAINETAFQTSVLPIFLFFKDYSKKPTMSAYRAVRSVLGNKLVSEENLQSAAEATSPSEWKERVFFVMISDWPEVMRIAPLSILNSRSVNVKEETPLSVLSFEETQSDWQALVKKEVQGLMKERLIRVKPDPRVGPMSCILNGAQIISEDMTPVCQSTAADDIRAEKERFAKNRRVADAYFSQNGNCGYILRDRPGIGLHVELNILSGWRIATNLGDDDEEQGRGAEQECYLKVRVEIVGSIMGSSKTSYDTPIRESRGYNPEWNQSAHFDVVGNHDLAALYFTVFQGTSNTDPNPKPIADAAVALREARIGYRALQLYSWSPKNGPSRWDGFEPRGVLMVHMTLSPSEMS